MSEKVKHYGKVLIVMTLVLSLVITVSMIVTQGCRPAANDPVESNDNIVVEKPAEIETVKIPKKELVSEDNNSGSQKALEQAIDSVPVETEVADVEEDSQTPPASPPSSATSLGLEDDDSWSTKVYNQNTGRLTDVKQFIYADTDTTPICVSWTKYDYDQMGRVVLTRRLADPSTGTIGDDDLITINVYDYQGNITQTITKGAGSTSTASIETNDIVSKNVYYDNGRLDYTVDPKGYITAYEYDNLGRVASVHRQVSEDDESNNGITAYTASNSTLVARIAAAEKSGVTGFAMAWVSYTIYDEVGRIQQVYEANANYAKPYYDYMGRTIDVVKYNSSSTILSRSLTVYDNVGNVLRQVALETPVTTAIDPMDDGAGGDINLAVDRVVDYEYYDSTTNPTSYDFTGMLYKQITYNNSDSTPIETEYVYNNFDMPKYTIHPDGSHSGMEYYNYQKPQWIWSIAANSTNGEKNIVKLAEVNYDKYGNVIKQRQLPVDNNHLMQNFSDLATYVDTSTTSRDIVSEFDYDGFGRLLTAIDPKGKITEHTYAGDFGLKDSTTVDYGGIAQLTEFDYDRLGRQETITGYADGSTAQTTTYSYDKLSRITDVDYPDTENVHYTYNSLSKVTQRIDQMERATKYEYDILGSLKEKHVDETSPYTSFVKLEEFTYDDLGRMALAKKYDDLGTTVIAQTAYNSFDLLGGPTEVTDSYTFDSATETRTSSYLYDQQGSFTQVTYPGVSAVVTDYARDASGRIDTVSQTVGENTYGIASYKYVGSQVAQKIHTGLTDPVVQANEFDEFGRLKSIEAYANDAGIESDYSYDIGTDIQLTNFVYAYDKNSNIIDQQFLHNPNGQARSYQYDDMNRLVHVSYQEEKEITDNLLGHWQMDETTGTVINDSSMNDLDGTFTGETNATTVAGRINTAIDFDGTDDYVDLGTDADLKPAFPVSISAWVNLDTIGACTVVSLDDPSGSNYYGIFLEITSAGKAVLSYGDGGGVTTSDIRSIEGSTTLTTGKWYHIAGVIRDTYDMDLYVNGINENGSYSGTGGELQYSTTGHSFIGDADLDGSIDDVRIYDRSLSYADVSTLYELGSGDAFAHWKLDETTGTTAADNSNNALDGTFGSSPVWTSAGKVGGCLTFDGTDDYLACGTQWNISDFGGSTGSVTIAGWVKPDSVDTYNVITKYMGGVYYFSAGMTGAGSGKLKCMVRDNTNNINYWPESLGTISANQWTHVVFILEGGVGYKFYINGQLDREVFDSNIGPYQYSGSGYIGHGINATDYFFDGSLDDIRVYDTVLSASEIENMYERTSGSLIGHWALNGNADDATANDNDGTLYGSPTLVDGVKDGAVEFDGTDDYVDLGTDSSLDISGTVPVFTISAWINPAEVNDFDTIISNSEGGGVTAVRFNMDILGNKLRVCIGNGTSFSSYYSAADTFSSEETSKWHHVSVVSDGANVKLFINGLQSGSTGTMISGGLASSTASWKIGQGFNSSSYLFTGLIDDVRIYDRVLFEDEIYDLADYETFNYDKLGNRTDVVNRNGLADKYAVDPLTNRYDNASVTDATVSHVYDDCGNLTDDGDYQYSWDYENRLLTVTRKIDSVVVAQYDYDALGRRIRKYDCIANAKTLYWYNNNWQVLTETDGDNVELRRNIFGNYIDELIGYNDVSGSGDDIHWVLHDHLYSPVALVDSSGTIVERYEYDAYGKPTIYDGDYQEISTTAHDNQIYFTGRRVDFLDGGDKLLQYSRNRYLDYQTGRWLSHDPLGYVDGLNLYEYVKSFPFKAIDPHGLYIDVNGDEQVGPPYISINNNEVQNGESLNWQVFEMGDIYSLTDIDDPSDVPVPAPEPVCTPFPCGDPVVTYRIEIIQHGMKEEPWFSIGNWDISHSVPAFEHITFQVYTDTLQEIIIPNILGGGNSDASIYLPTSGWQWGFTDVLQDPMLTRLGRPCRNLVNCKQDCCSSPDRKGGYRTTVEWEDTVLGVIQIDNISASKRSCKSVGSPCKNGFSKCSGIYVMP
ncbi:MAG: hypothetical protein JEZ07_12400 [Phycisphaerae bacterium]|nr:hypothetical protein [Phycisphaerae bacterium]